MKPFRETTLWTECAALFGVVVLTILGFGWPPLLIGALLLGAVGIHYGRRAAKAATRWRCTSCGVAVRGVGADELANRCSVTRGSRS